MTNETQTERALRLARIDHKAGEILFDVAMRDRDYAVAVRFTAEFTRPNPDSMKGGAK